MKILFNDLVQNSNAPQEIKSSALKDYFVVKDGSLIISFNKPVDIDCVGIGDCSAASIKISLLSKVPGRFVNGGSPLTKFQFGIAGGFPSSCEFSAVSDGMRISPFPLSNIPYNGSGLYMLDREKYKSVRSLRIDVEPGTKIGRLAFGKLVHIPTTPAKGLSYVGTAAEHITSSGQLIQGMGGYTYRTLTLDSRYKIGEEAMKEIIAGRTTIGAGYPFFIDLEDEYYKLPFRKFYGIERNQKNWVFQGGVTKFLYSMKFEFEECF